MNEIELIIEKGEETLRNAFKNIRKKQASANFDLLVISGPSGVGKGTIMQHIEKKLGIKKIPIYTTRKKRKGEIHGKHYYFITKEEFEKFLNEGRFLVYGKVHETFQGIDKKILEKVKNSKRKFYLEIHISLAEKLIPVLEAHGIKVLHIFILPPSYKELFSRLLSRGEKNLEIISQRLKNGIKEIEKSIELNCLYVVNDILENCTEKITKMIIET